MGKYYRCDWLPQPEGEGGRRGQSEGDRERESGVKRERKGNHGREKQIDAEKKTLHLRDAQKSKRKKKEENNSSEVETKPSGRGSWGQLPFLQQPDSLESWLNRIIPR